MKPNPFLLVLLCCVMAVFAHARTFYFSSSTGIDAPTRTTTQAQNQSTPWKSLAQASSLLAGAAVGDTLLFKRGDVFYGAMSILTSGTAAKPIVIGAYGTGAAPVFTGFVTINNWTSLGNGIFESDSLPTAQSTLNMLTINGLPFAMGRFPNADAPNGGYLNFEGRTSTTITDSSLAFDAGWVGAEAAIRTTHWNSDRGAITAVSSINSGVGSTLTISASGFTIPAVKSGYFLQNSPKTLDKFGEWYYNPSTRRVRMFFGSNSPTAFAVQAATQDIIIQPKAAFVVIRDITINGANSYGIWNDWIMNNGSDVSILNCNISLNGIDGIYLYNKNRVTIDNCVFDHNNSNGVSVAQDSNIVVTNSTFTNIALLQGMLKRNTHQRYGFGIFHETPPNVKSMTIKNCTIKNIGYCGIYSDADSALIQNNYVDSTCLILDDGGAIYVVNFTSQGQTPRLMKGNVISHNMVLNCIGAPFGVSDNNLNWAHGIYSDDNMNNLKVIGNTSANCGGSGIYLHNTNRSVLDSNVVYNNLQYQLFLQDDTNGDSMYNNTISHNTLFSKAANQLVILLAGDFNTFFRWGTFDNNVYSRPFNENNIIQSNWFGHGAQAFNNYSLTTWRAATGMDVNTTMTPFAISDVSKISFNTALDTQKNLRFCSKYFDVKNLLYTGKVVLNPYSSLILLKP